MKRLLTPLLFAAAFLLFINLHAQPGANDPAFNAADVGFGYGDAVNGSVAAIVVQPDGKIIIGGEFYAYNGTPRNRIARLNADGTLDATFDVGTGANYYVSSVALQNDGKILIGGSFMTYNGTARRCIARLNADGSLDDTFTVGTGASANSEIFAVAVQSDGKILIGGSFTAYNGTARKYITRLNTDGSLDGTFAASTGVNNWIGHIVIQSDGKIMIGGHLSRYIARLNTNGTIDGTFTVGAGIGDGYLGAMAVQGDGKVIVGGNFETYNGTARNNIARLNANGSLDATFIVGEGASDYVNAVAVQSDGKIMIGGLFATYNNNPRKGIARLNANGSLDTSFIVGTGLIGGVLGSADIFSVQSDGKILIGGDFGAYNDISRNGIARLSTDGSVDLSFVAGTGANGIIHAIAVQSDGKIIIGGDFTTYNGVLKNHIARLNTDGSLDATFVSTGTDSTVYTIAIQSDGKVIIGGNIDACNGIARNRLARLNTDGSLDAAFNPGADAGVNYVHVYSIVIQNDGKINIGGNIYSSSGQSYSIVRLNTDGSLDTAFDPSPESYSYGYGGVRTMAMQVDGKIIIGRETYSSTHGDVARLNKDGSLDNTFRPTFPGSILATAIQADGKIMIGGYFSSGGTGQIARLNTDGSLDGTFSAGVGANDAPNAIIVQSDGKVIIAGRFSRYKGTAINRIARLNADGSLDNTFNVGTGPSRDIYAMAVQSNGNIIIGGDFNAYNNAGRNRLARVLNCIDAATPALAASAAAICSTQNTTLSIATGTLNSATAWKWYSGSCAGTAVGSGPSVTVSPAATTTYYARGEGGCTTPGACASLTITVKPLPDVTTGLNGTTIKANQNNATYQWLDCNQNKALIAGAADQSFMAIKNGDYAVIVTQNGCSATSACVNVTITSIHETTKNNDALTVYPNPSHGTVMLQSLTEGSYSIRNELGQTLQSFKLDASNNYTRKIENLPPGIYFIIGSHKNEMTTKKILVAGIR